MKSKSINVSFSDMPTEKLGVYVMDVQQPYLQKTLNTFFLCAKSISNINKNEIGNKIMDDILTKLGNLIVQHFEMDEEILFPYIRLKISNDIYSKNKEFPISLRKIKAEHNAILKLFKKLRLISNNYTPDESATPALKLCYAQLFNFEQDMAKQIFLEDEILLPRFVKMTKINGLN